MKVGELYSSVELDGPLGQRGPTLQGRVKVRFGPAGSPNDVVELFGPLHVSINVSGRLKTKVLEGTAHGRHTYRARMPLFARRQDVFQGAVRIARFETEAFPFTFVLPSTSDVDDASPSFSSRSMWKPGHPWDVTRGKPLPPTLHFHRTGFSSEGEAHVEYGIQVHLSTPGIDVSIPESRTQPFEYAPPPVPGPPSFDNPTVTQGSFCFKDRRPRPPTDSPPSSKGLREKTSRLFSSFQSTPRFALSWSITAPTHCHIGQPLVVHVRVESQRPDDQLPASPDPSPPPRVTLTCLVGAIRSHVSCRAQGSLGGDKLLEGEEGGGDRALVSEVVEAEGGSNHIYSEEGEGWTRWTVGLSSELTGGLPGTEFRTALISRRYELRIQAILEITGNGGEERCERIKRRAGLVVSPPLLSEGDGHESLEVQAEPAVGGSIALPPNRAVEIHGDDDDDGDVDGTLPPPGFAVAVGEESERPT